LATSQAVIAALGVLGVLGFDAPASAQSKRYPPEPADKDAEQGAKSKLWQAASTPEHHSYKDLVHLATEELRQRTSDHTLGAIKKLDAAIQLMPHEPEAYRLRGNAYFDLPNFAKCAQDLAAADAYTQRDDQPPKDRAELHIRLGVCQARAGKLSDAEKTLAETAASGSASGELWLRLGEVRIAMGKLDEAIAALSSALGATDAPVPAMAHFLLAAAYDRARRPADALSEAKAGVELDQKLEVLHNPALPPISAGELDYVLGLAYSVESHRGTTIEPPHPEHVLAYFRRFVAAAPDSPWRKRAEEHIRDLKTSELPDTITRIAGTASLDTGAARTAARRAMPQMRACLARFPAVVVQVEVTKAGPRTPPTDRMQPHFFRRPEGVIVNRAVGNPSDAELDTIDRCLSPLATRLPFPAIKERDTYYTATFYVVGP
jgi:tetratricopeptide (TPR) repeat protein